jgi:hypothetical protein
MRFDQLKNCRAFHERHVPAQHQNVAGMILKDCLGLPHRVPGAQLLVLQNELGLPAGARLPHPLGLKAHHHDQAIGANRLERTKDVIDQRLAGKRLQHFGLGRFHALAPARRENDGR